MKNKFKEEVKNAICTNDLVFLLQNINENNINLRFSDEDNDTLLMYSISDKESNAYKFFLERNADLKVVNDDGENILHSAIYSGKIERVIEVIEYAELNKKSIEGTTPLLLSIGLENKTLANYLIDQGADINCSDNEGNSPIHLASYFGLTSVVKNLIINRADIYKKTSKGNLSLALAVNEGHKEIVEILYKQMYK